MLGLCRGAQLNALSQHKTAQPHLAIGVATVHSTVGRGRSAQVPGHGYLPAQAPRSRAQIVCMAHPRRVAKVASQIQREIGDMFVSDTVVQEAICPERQLGDNALSAVASISDVYVSNDLQVVKVYVSIYSDDKGKRRAMDNLQRLEPYVRRMIGQRVRLRLTPEIRFEYDDTLEEMDLVARVIGAEEIERYRAEAEGAAEHRPEGQQEEGNDYGDEDGDDDGFFDDVEDEEEEALWDERKQRQAYPNPFGELFAGEGEGLLGSRPDGSGGRGRGRGGRGGRGNGRGNGSRREANATAD